jgi:ribosomal protein S25
MSSLQKITAKEVQLKLNISKNSAYKVLKDIKEENNIRIVTQYHLAKYLNVPVAQF